MEEDAVCMRISNIVCPYAEGQARSGGSRVLLGHVDQLEVGIGPGSA